MSRPSILKLDPSTLTRGSSLSALLVAAVTACSGARFSTEPGAPTLVLPGSFAEGKAEPAGSSAPKPVAAPTSSASAVSAPVAPALTPSTLPDPTPLRMAELVEYELELNEGKIRVVSAKAVKVASPVETPRRLGRYAIELRIGPELLERLRFDFPGTAADEPEAPGKQKLYAPLTLGARAIARVKLLVPQSPRVRQAVLVDRGLNSATELPWPLPEVPKVPAVPSASAVAPTAPSAVPLAQP